MDVRDARGEYRIKPAPAANADEVPRGYKRTEVGVIPEEWLTTTIDAETDFLTGFPFASNGFATSGMRLLRGSNVKRGATDWSDDITEYWPSSSTKLDKFVLREGDVAIAMDGALVGRSFAVLRSEDLPALLVQRVARLREKDVDPRLIAAWCGNERFVRHVDSVKTHTAIPHISPKDIKTFPLVLPADRNEQRAIAEALGDADALLGALDRLIAKKRDLKQAAMQQLLTGQTRLPGFTAEWDVRPLGTLARIHSGGTPSTAEGRFWGGDVPWCTPTDITALDGRKYLSSTARTITAEGLAASSAEIVPAYSVVMTSRATIGECAINTVPVSTNQGFKNFVPFDDTDAEFLYYMLSTQKQGFIRLCGGSTFLEIGKAQILQYEVRLPNTKEEQAAISAVLSDMDAEIEALEARRAKTRDLKQAMMQELLTGRTRLVEPAQGTLTDRPA